MEKKSSPPTTTDSNAVLLLGKYKLGRLLGRGAFAKVYYAQSVIDDLVVAIKVIDKSKIKNTSMESRIIGEISAMRRLNHHPNIIKIHEVMATKTKIYIVMEYAKGGELLSKITKHGRLSESRACFYFQQLVAALHFCHVNGITHRDLKPQNLLLDHSGNLKISDFGLSALPEQLRSDGLLHTACGTPAYTAPEVIGHRGYVGNKSDAWSCGVVLFVLLAGDIPFDDTNIVVMYHRILRKEYKFPSWFSKTARSVISKLLDPNPKTRTSIKELMDLAWFKKSMKTKDQPSEHESMLLDDKDNRRPIVKMVTAFDIISMSSGLDLSAIFEESREMLAVLGFEFPFLLYQKLSMEKREIVQN